MPTESNWKVSRDAAYFLRVSERQLFRLRKAGILVAGIHFIRKFPTANSALLYQVDLCQQAMQDASSRNVQTLETAEA